MSNKKNQEDDRGEAARKSGMAYAAAFALFTTVAIFLGIGWAIDRWTGKSPLFVVIGVVLGAAIGFYEFYRLAMKISE